MLQDGYISSLGGCPPEADPPLAEKFPPSSRRRGPQGLQHKCP